MTFRIRRSFHHILAMTMVLAVMFVLSACGKKAEPNGIWQNMNVPESMEFKPDNTGVIQGKNLPPLMFTWKKSADHTYVLEVNFQGQMKQLKAVVSKDALELEGEGGKEHYRKAP